MGVLPTCEVPEIDALIIYPTLGAPQILPPNPKECTIIIAVDADGYRQFRDPCKGAVLVNHHLRLISLDDDKENLLPSPDPCDYRLYSAILEEHYHPHQQNNKENGKMLREQYIEINELPLERHSQFSGSGSLMYWYPASVTKPRERLAQRKLVGCLSPEARSLHGRERFDYYFAVTLKNLGSSEAELGSIPKSWAWVVTTSPKNGRKQHHFEKGCATPLPKFHQPLDRLIRNELCKLSDPETFKSATSGMVELDAQFEIAISGGVPDYTPAPQTEPHRRVQAWHPVVVAKNIQPLKLGHLTDTHVSVRAATIANSKVKVLEGVNGEEDHLKPVGEIVAHTFKSFKALIDKASDEEANALAFTGDLTDFNRNIDPRKTEGMTDTGDLWRTFNVHANIHKADGVYRRHLDQLYVYSLMMYALRTKKLPSFHVSGNHEGYAWPYGISPRVDSRLTKVAVGDNYSYKLNSAAEAEKKASEKLREAVDKREHAERNLRVAKERHESAQARIKSLDEEIKSLKSAQSGMQSFLGTGPNKDRIKALEAERSALDKQLPGLRHNVKNAEYNLEIAKKQQQEAQEKHQEKLKALQEFQADQETVNKTSRYFQKKATEMLPSDHNLTIYEACLAYGPTYGQTPASKENFRSEQFDWLHWLYTPFSDQNLYPCSTKLLGEDARQVVTLLGWGVGERLVTLLNTAGDFAGDRKGEDRRGIGFLPYATESINPIQLELIKVASDVSKARNAKWSVLSHFVVTNFEDTVPATVNHEEAGFQPANEPKSHPGTWNDNNAQFNKFNWGGCERGLQDYLDGYASLGKAPEAGKVNVHLSGHSHRGGIYTLTKSRNRFPGRRDGLEIKCRLPNFPGELGRLPGGDKGTLFVVGSTGGPMGKQAINGWSVEKRDWVDNAIGGAFLDGWLTRPPSGLLVDTQESKIRYLKSDAGAAPNEVPRLAIMLDYREIMSVYEKHDATLASTRERHERARPIVFCPVDFYGRTHFATGLPVRISREMQALKCLDLQNIKVWVFIRGPGSTQTADGGRGGRPGAANPAPSGKSGWHACGAYVSDVPSAFKTDRFWKEMEHALFFKDKGALLAEALFPKQFDAYGQVGSDVACAFVEIPLQQPTHPGVDMLWDEEVRWQGESWVFPVDIHRVGGPQSTEILRRGEKESGEIPKWEFLERNLGYPNAKGAIKL